MSFLGVLALFAWPAYGQIVVNGEATQLTLDGFVNVTAGDEEARFDGGARLLGRLRLHD